MVLSEHNTLNKVDLQLWNKKKTLKSKIQTYFWSTDDYCVSYDCNIAIDMNTKVSGSKKQIYKLNNFAVFHKKEKVIIMALHQWKHILQHQQNVAEEPSLFDHLVITITFYFTITKA